MTTVISSIVIDCADPVALAGFYAKATGWQVAGSDPEYATVTGGPVPLAFQRIDGYRGPGWPNDGKHLHLDLTVPDVEETKRALVALGATLPAQQPGGEEWTVVLDPEGHPFCVMPG